jgi:hypothetical protein
MSNLFHLESVLYRQKGTFPFWQGTVVGLNTCPSEFVISSLIIISEITEASVKQLAIRLSVLILLSGICILCGAWFLNLRFHINSIK